LEYLPVGVVDYITKPLQPPIVATRLQSHLKLKRYRDLWDSPSMDSQWKMDALLAREWQRALRNQTPISLVLIDIDFFKEYEAHECQSTGDKCLCLVGEVLRSCAKRDMDFIARHDTHAFACLLPDTDTEGARRVCKQMQEKVAQLNIPHPCSPVTDRITVSIGVATVRPTFKLDQDYLRYQAEVLLQKSRDCGHNQVRIGEG
jgi:diguanylate cyclase (GGDEF)-like protein